MSVIPTRCPPCDDPCIRPSNNTTHVVNICSHGEQVCLLLELWKRCQFQRCPKATSRVLATEESPELRATTTVLCKSRSADGSPRVIDSSRCFLEAMADPGVPMIFCVRGTGQCETSPTTLMTALLDLNTTLCERAVFPWPPLVEFSHSSQRRESSTRLTH